VQDACAASFADAMVATCGCIAAPSVAIQSV